MIANRLVKIISICAALALASVTGLAAAQAGNDIKSWQGKVVKLVAKKQVYPRAAMQQELEGKARVKINFDRSGSITGHEVLQSTGHAVLDREVDKLVERINPLPAPPSALGDDKLVIVLPLTWAIQ